MEQENVIEFYKQTSCYTDLGFYKEFAKNLPEDLETFIFTSKTSNNSSI